MAKTTQAQKIFELDEKITLVESTVDTVIDSIDSIKDQLKLQSQMMEVTNMTLKMLTESHHANQQQRQSKVDETQPTIPEKPLKEKKKHTPLHRRAIC